MLAAQSLCQTNTTSRERQLQDKSMEVVNTQGVGVAVLMKMGFVKQCGLFKVGQGLTSVTISQNLKAVAILD